MIDDGIQADDDRDDDAGNDGRERRLAVADEEPQNALKHPAAIQRKADQHDVDKEKQPVDVKQVRQQHGQTIRSKERHIAVPRPQLQHARHRPDTIADLIAAIAEARQRIPGGLDGGIAHEIE